MATTSLGAVSSLLRAVKAMLSGITVLVPVIGAVAVFSAVGEWLVYDAVVGDADVGVDQSVLVQLIFSWLGVQLLLDIFLGPITAAALIYVGRSWMSERPSSLYKGMNFALTRYKRLFLPRLVAQLSIQLGMLVVVPGILFMLQYAFVDAVATLEDEKWPLARSTKLTKGRRRTLFLVFLPFFVLGQVLPVLDLMAMAYGPVAVWLVKLGTMLFMSTMWMAFYMQYEARVAARKARKQQQQQQPADTP